MSFLQDPGWISVFISSLSVIVSVITAFIIYRKSQQRKNLSYQIISNVPLLNGGIQFQGKIQILVNGNSLNNANVVVLRIWNSGNVPILPTDFNGPFIFNFGTGATVIDVEILEVIPGTINPSITKSAETLQMEPLLLNSKDSIRLKVLLTGFNGDIRVDTRISGINQIQRFYQSRRNLHLAAYSTIIASCTVAAIVAIFIGLKFGQSNLLSAIAVAIPFFFGIIILFILYLLSRKR